MENTSLYTMPSSMFPLIPEKYNLLIPDILKLYKNLNIIWLHSITKKTIADLMLYTNSYSSNLLEGNKTNPLEIENAIKGREIDEKSKTKVFENTAYIKAEEIIKKRIENEPDLNISSKEFISFIHKTFYENIPEENLFIKHNNNTYKIIPGEFRKEEVKIGKHIPPYSKNIEDFLDVFSKYYNYDNLDEVNKIIAFAASHHRLVWIHPFLDGNGRVARLYSTAVSKKIGIDEEGLWSIARGLAKYNKDYYAELESADSIRQGDLDGRGNLSEKKLLNFCKFFINTSTDQLEFVKNILEIEKYQKRLERLSKNISNEKQSLAEDFFKILQAVSIKGEINRGSISKLLNKPERTSRIILKKLTEKELLVSLTPKSPVRLNLPIKYAVQLFPGLFPEKVELEIIEKDDIKNAISIQTNKRDVQKEIQKYFEKLEDSFEDKKNEILELRELIKYLKEEQVLELLENLSEISFENYNKIYDKIFKVLQRTIPNSQ